MSCTRHHLRRSHQNSNLPSTGHGLGCPEGRSLQPEATFTAELTLSPSQPYTAPPSPAGTCRLSLGPRSRLSTFKHFHPRGFFFSSLINFFDRTLGTKSRAAPEHKPVLSLCRHMSDVDKTEQVILRKRPLEHQQSLSSQLSITK